MQRVGEIVLKPTAKVLQRSRKVQSVYAFLGPELPLNRAMYIPATAYPPLSPRVSMPIVNTRMAAQRETRIEMELARQHAASLFPAAAHSERSDVRRIPYHNLYVTVDGQVYCKFDGLADLDAETNCVTDMIAERVVCRPNMPALDSASSASSGEEMDADEAIDLVRMDLHLSSDSSDDDFSCSATYYSSEGSQDGASMRDFSVFDFNEDE